MTDFRGYSSFTLRSFLVLLFFFGKQHSFVLFVGLESAASLIPPSSANERVWEGTSSASVLFEFNDFLAKAVSTSSFCSD